MVFCRFWADLGDHYRGVLKVGGGVNFTPNLSPTETRPQRALSAMFESKVNQTNFWPKCLTIALPILGFTIEGVKGRWRRELEFCSPTEMRP